MMDVALAYEGLGMDNATQYSRKLIHLLQASWQYLQGTFVAIQVICANNANLTPACTHQRQRSELNP